MPLKKANRKGSLSRVEPSVLSNPFAAMRQLSDEMERLFEGVGFREPRFPKLWRGFDVGSPWGPDVDVFERKGQLVVHADLPGLSKKDVKVEITKNELTIEGERKVEQEEKDKGYYRSERAHGSFQRTIRLPEGVNTARAKASFKDGVLEIAMPAPKKKAPRGRRIEIKS